LYSRGYVTREDRREYVKTAIGELHGDAHNPLWDATATALAAYALLSQESPSSTVHTTSNNESRV
jgi:hypothetical protein